MTNVARQHAVLAPSSAHRWTVCPGSVRLTRDVVEVENDYAQDGTEAHTALSDMLTLYRTAGDAHTISEFISISPTSYWTHRKDTFDERCASVQFAYDYIVDLIETFTGCEWGIENAVPLFYSPQETGYVDVWIYEPAFDTLYVIDYKHGAGVNVEAEYLHNIQNTINPVNPQLGIYALSLMNTLKKYNPQTVCLTIIQPRAFSDKGPVKTAVRSGVWMKHYFSKHIQHAVDQTQNPLAPLVPGEQQCRFCTAAAMCPARERQALSVINSNFKTVIDVPKTLPEPKTLPVEHIANVLRFKAFIENWLSEVESVAYKYVMEGNQIPGFKLVEGNRRRRWHGDTEKIAIHLCKLAGINNTDDVMPRKLIGITEAETLIKENILKVLPRSRKKEAKDIVARAMAELTVKDSTDTYNLVPLEDKRPVAAIGARNFVNVKTLENN